MKFYLHYSYCIIVFFGCFSVTETVKLECVVEDKIPDASLGTEKFCPKVSAALYMNTWIISAR